MDIVAFDNHDTLTTKSAKDWRRIFGALRWMHNLVGIVSSGEFSSQGTGSDLQLSRDDFDFVLENVDPKGDITIFLSAIEKAHEALKQKYADNHQELISPKTPIKNKIVLVDDDRVTTSVLARKGLPTIWYRDDMAVGDLFDAIKTKLKGDAPDTHSIKPT